jgi:HK97 family phage major capsid protein
MSDLDDRFQDKLIELVERDVLRNQWGEALPTVPVYETLQVDPIPAETGTPVQPFNEDLIKANQYDGRAWDGGQTSYFRDLVTIAEKNHRMTALMRAQVEGRDMPLPELSEVVPSRLEHLTGGVEGAIARSSEASMRVEKRVREVRSRMDRDRPKSYKELRAAITSGSGGVGLMPQNGAPEYVASLFADAARAKARLAPRLFQGQLPPTGNIVLVPRSTTGAVMTVHTAEGATYTDSSGVFDTASSPVITVVGKQDVSRELIDRGVNTDASIAASLGASFGAVLEAQVINGAGASGELTGLLGVSGITSNTYTDASPSASKNFGALQSLISATSTAYGAPVDAAVLHTRRLAFMRDNAVVNQVLDGSGIGVANVIETEAMPTNLGAGTNQDPLLVLALQETPLFIGPVQFAVLPGVLSSTLQVRLIAYAYVALVGARIPASIGKATGTGLIPPVFV